MLQLKNYVYDWIHTNFSFKQYNSVIKMIRIKKERKSNIQPPYPVYFKTATISLIADQTEFMEEGLLELKGFVS